MLADPIARPRMWSRVSFWWQAYTPSVAKALGDRQCRLIHTEVRPMHIRGAHHIAIYTRDLTRLEAFYTQALGFPVARRWQAPGIVFLDAGGLWLELTRQDAPDDGTQPRALDQGVGLNHLA